MDMLYGNDKCRRRRYSLYTPPISSPPPVKTFCPAIHDCAILDGKCNIVSNGEHRLGKGIGSNVYLNILI